MRELKVQAESADVAKSEMLIDTDLDATQQDLAMTAQSSGKALIALINEVLDQAKIESGRLELEAGPLIYMAVYVSEQVPEVLIGDPGRLRQIITNLVGNSVKWKRAL
ncbi:CHASE [Musa troglodytarum]|uniref:histidine kinase n=1 Tax=Musa troglodytarum TaxID=320322 RepID=A0A9E7EDQ3_9LILI|nr:CHASE [Musa troglodytarum]